MHRHRSLSVLATASLALALALALGSTTALGALPESQKGKIGTFVIPDSNAKPGVACTYDAGGPNDMGNDLDLMDAKGPRAFARDRTGDRDQQTVGVRFLFQHSVNEGGSGGWVAASRTKMIKKTAYDDKAARFATQSWLVPFEENYHYRTLVVIKWYRPGSTIKGQGSVKQRFVYYQVSFNGPLMVEQDRCLPNP